MNAKKSANPVPALDASIWLRLPRPGARCPVSGLSRSTLAELVRPCPRNEYAPPVDSRILRRPGTQRGILLINRKSLLEYIDQLPTPVALKDIANSNEEIE